MKWLNKLKYKIAKILMKKKVDSEHTIERKSHSTSSGGIGEESPALPTGNVMKDQAIDLHVPVEIKNGQETFVAAPRLENLVRVESTEIQAGNFENGHKSTCCIGENNEELLHKLIVNKAKKKTDSTILLNTESELKMDPPLTPLPKYNEDGDYDKFKNHYLYYLENGTNYERKVVIQKVKKAVNENKERHMEWIKPLLDLSGFTDNIIRQYAFLALLSFPLDALFKDVILKHFENDSFDVIKKRVEKEREAFIETSRPSKTDPISHFVSKEDQSTEIKWEQRSKSKTTDVKKKVVFDLSKQKKLREANDSFPKEILYGQVKVVERVEELDAVAEKPLLQKSTHVSETKERNNRSSQRTDHAELKLSSCIKPIEKPKSNSLYVEPAVQLEIHDFMGLGNDGTAVSAEQLSKANSAARYHPVAKALEIQQECKERSISSIFHFTNARNVPKIMSSGILSVEQLKKQSMKYEHNDKNRLDNMLHASCWSISFTNTFYFHNARKREPEMKWCVIECDASPLWELPCYFFETNAASNKMKKVHYSHRVGVNSLKKMFERDDSEILPAYYPTDVQAEVLIGQPVLPSKIKSIHTNNKLVYDYYSKRYPGMFKYDDKLYKYRN